MKIKNYFFLKANIINLLQEGQDDGIEKLKENKRDMEYDYEALKSENEER